MHHIGQHLFTLNTDPCWQTDGQREDGPPALRVAKSRQAILPKSKRRRIKLTRRKLLLRYDWKTWQASEHKQLDCYEVQHTFVTPTIPPPNSNILLLLWTYVIKDCGTKNAR